MIGIAMKCYILINASSGLYGWMQGREMKELRAGAQGQERSLFRPDDNELQTQAVNTNDCQYLEDPIEGYKRLLDQQEVEQEQERKIDKIVEGEQRYCIVDADYGQLKCQYSSWEQCQSVHKKRGEYCIDRKSK